MSNSELNKLKSRIKNGTGVTLSFPSNEVVGSNDVVCNSKFVTNTQVSRLHKAFANNSTANIKLLETQLHKIEQSGGYLDRLLGPLLKIGLSLIGNILKPLA